MVSQISFAERYAQEMLQHSTKYIDQLIEVTIEFLLYTVIINVVVVDFLSV